MKKFLAILLSLGILIGTVSLTAFTVNLTPEITMEEFTEQLGEMNREYKDEPVSNRLIVKSKHDIPILDGVAIVEGYKDLHIVQFDDSDSAIKALKYYRSNKLIDYAEPDLIVNTAESTSVNEPMSTYGNHLSWGSESIGVDDFVDTLSENLPQMIVGIIDTGVDLDHELLQNRIIPTNFNVSSSGLENSEDDDDGHGTHVAGIVADNTTDNIRIAGYKCLNNVGAGALSGIVTAIYKAIEDDVDVINMSLGAKGTSYELENAVNYAIEHHIIVCVAAGNSGHDAENHTPANIEPCITVAAIDEYDGQPYWTNHGSLVDIAAPGVAIYSTYMDNSFKTLSGTSMATPFVSAAAALLKLQNPGFLPEEICDLMTTNGRKWNYHTEYTGLNDVPALFLGNTHTGITPRTARPVFSVPSGKYTESISVSIHCEDENARIYYTTDGTRATEDNGILYTQPISVDRLTVISAAAYCEGKLKSSQAWAHYYLTYLDDESNYEIDEDGIITRYKGNNRYLTIPDSVDGITVTGIGQSVFVQKDMVMVKLPDSLTTLKRNAFAGNSNLYSVDAHNIQTIEYGSFNFCTKLELFDFGSVISIGDYAFARCKLISEVYGEKIKTIGDNSFALDDSLVGVWLPKCKSIGDFAFRLDNQLEIAAFEKLETVGNSSFINCIKLNEVDLCQLNSIGTKAFYYCKALSEVNMSKITCSLSEQAFAYCPIETVYTPCVSTIGSKVFIANHELKTIYAPLVTTIGSNCFASDADIETMFLPKVQTLNSLPDNSVVTIYCSNELTSMIANENVMIHIVAPSDSNAESWANENGYTFTDSDTMVDAIGTHTDKNGNTVFEFGWKNIDDIKQYASEVEYYATSLPLEGKVAAQQTDEVEETTYFQAVGENELCGCVNIDGMVFRSRSLTAGENELEPENGCEHDWQIVYTVSVPNDTIVVFRCEKCDSYYRIRFMEHINTDYPPLDMNNDNIVNAKDLACIIKEYQRS